jgi:hypothetical protein
VARPALSLRASIRLPWPRFGKPLCDPGQRDFPSPVLAWAVPAPPSPRVRSAPADPEHGLCYAIQESGNLAKMGSYPYSPTCHFQVLRCKAPSTPRTATVGRAARPRLRARFPQLNVWGRPWDRPVPRAPSPATGVTGRGGASAPRRRALPRRRRYYGLMRQSRSLPPPRSSRSAGLCRSRSAPAGGGTFPTLSLRTFPRMPGPLPRRSPRCACSFLPWRHRPSPRSDRVGNPQGPAQRLQCGASFRGYSHSRLLQASVFARPPDRSHRGGQRPAGRPGL